MKRNCLIFALIILAGGCSSTDSSNVKTKGIAAHFKAIASEDGVTEVTASLTIGSTFVDLSSSDTLYAVAGGQTKTMKKSRNLLGIIDYSAQFSFIDENSTFAIKFIRQEEQSAENSSASLPALFTIEMPASGEIFSHGQDVHVVWNPPGSSGNIQIESSGTCGTTSYHKSVATVADSVGETTIKADDLVPTPDVIGPSTACDLTIDISRNVPGSVDPAFEGGEFTAGQARSVPVHINP